MRVYRPDSVARARLECRSDRRSHGEGDARRWCSGDGVRVVCRMMSKDWLNGWFALSVAGKCSYHYCLGLGSLS